MAAPHFHSIEACVFDAYGTLFDVNTAAEQCSQELGEIWQPLAERWRAKQLQYTWLRTLAGEFADFWQITGDALDYALASYQLSDPGLRRRLMDLYLCLDTYPEVAEVLRRLKAVGMKLAILSNGSPDMLNSAVENAGLNDLFHVLISANDVQVFKPHPEIYRLGVDRLGLPAEKMAFQSANPWDVYGAACYGYRTVWINRQAEVSDRLPRGADAELTTLEGLPAVVGVSEAMQVNEVRFRTMVENAQVLIYTLTPEGRFAYLSPNFSEFTGYDADEYIGRRLADLLHPDDVPAAAARLDRARTRGDRWEPFEHRLRHASGEWRWYNSSATLMRGRDDTLREIVGVTQHVSELKKALDKLHRTQAQLVESEKTASLGKLVKSLSHEMNSPLGVLRSSQETMSTAVGRLLQAAGCEEASGGLARNLKAIEDATALMSKGTERVVGIVERLRRFARLDEAEIKEVDLRECIDDALALMGTDQLDGIEIVRQYEDDLPRLRCYPARLNHVFLNLLTNAREAVGDSGRIVVRAAKRGAHLVVEVEDDGRGIEPARLGQIFEPGFSSRGTRVRAGLGLTISRQIINDHDGKIDAHSDGRRGSTFTVLLPLTSRTSTTSE